MTNQTIPAAPIDLEGERAAAHRRVNAEAEARRLVYITPGAGQALTYQRKLEEAQRLQAFVAANPEAALDTADYPMLAATLGIDGEDLPSVATLVITLNGQFSVIGSALERVRALANKAIDEASTLAGITAASQVDWPY